MAATHSDPTFAGGRRAGRRADGGGPGAAPVLNWSVAAAAVLAAATAAAVARSRGRRPLWMRVQWTVRPAAWPWWAPLTDDEITREVV